MRGQNIKGNLRHDTGAYARCSYCGRYSDIPGTIYSELMCDCGKTKGWSGSFKAPTENSKWISERITKLYRARGVVGLYGRREIYFDKYSVHSYTRCGYWISENSYMLHHHLFLKWKWVSKKGRRRFAYPTKKEALESFHLRQIHRIKWGEAHIKNGTIFAEMCLKLKQ